MTATKLFNVRENRYEYVGDDVLDQAIRSGGYRLPAGQKIVMYDADGNAYDADNRTDFSKLSNFTFETNFRKENRERLEVAAEQPLLATAAAAARGATFGLSDVAADALGYAEKFKALKEANPVASTLGEVGGVLASTVALPGGGLVGGAAKAGQATASLAERAIASSVVKGAAEAGATTLAKDIAKRTAHKALTSGAGGFVEGSLYGLGQTISEAALGDPKEAAEHLVSNIGFSGLINGAFMGVGGAFGALTRRLPPGVSEAEFKATSEAVGSLRTTLNDTFQKAADEIATKPGLESKLGELIADGVSKVLPVTDETKAYLKSAFSDVEQGRKYLDFLDNAPEALQRVSETMEKMVRSTEQSSKFLAFQVRRESIARMPTQYAQNVEAGKQLADQAVKRIDQAINTIKTNKGAYDAPLAKELKLLRDEFAAKLLPQVDEAGKSIGGLTDNVQLMNEMNGVWRKIFDTKKFYSETPVSVMTPKVKRSATLMDNLYKDVVDLTFNEKVFSPQVAAENREISQMIAEQMGSFRELKSKFFTKRLIEGKKTEVFDPDKFTRFIKSDEAKRILQNDIFENYMVTSAKTMKMAEKFGVQEALFKEASGTIEDTFNAIREMKELKAAAQAIASLESYTGKSLQKTLAMGTLGAVLGGGPLAAIGTAVGFVVDNPLQTLRYVNKAQQQIIDNKSYINGALRRFMNLPKATTEGISSFGDAKPIVKGLAGFSVPRSLRLSATAAYDPDSDQPLSLEQVLTQPTDLTVTRVAERHQQLNGVLPNVSVQMGAQVFNAVEFLKSKMPTDPSTRFEVIPLEKDYIIPPAQRSKFERYVESINDPAGTIAKLADGTLTAEHVEALQVVYPSLYAETQRTVLEMLSEKPRMTFKQKVQLGLFMQVPTMPAYDPTVFASIQGQYALVEQQEQGMKVPQTLGQNMQTSFDRAVTR